MSPDNWNKFLETNSNLSFQDFQNTYKKSSIDYIRIDSNNSNLAKAISDLKLKDYNGLYQYSINHQNDFWKYTIKQLNISFKETPSSIFEINPESKQAEWFNKGKLNIVDSCITKSIEKTAIVCGTENSFDEISYAELYNLVNQYQLFFSQKGIKEEQPIALYLPLSIESVAIYLAIIRMGAIVVSVADSFGANALKQRLEIIDCETIITQLNYQYNSKTIDLANKVQEAEITNVFFLSGQIPSPVNNAWVNCDIESIPDFEEVQSVKADANSTINILFSSGTTKAPKAIPWTHKTPIKAAMDGYYHQDIKPEDVVSWTTGMGWMMAPWLIVSSLINKSTLAIYSGNYVSNQYMEFLEKSNVTILGLIPSIVAGWRHKKFLENRNFNIRLFSSTGEPSSEEDYLYLMWLTKFKSPIIEYCGGTEIGGGYITNSVLQPQKPGHFTTPTLGTRLDFFDENKNISDTQGDVFIYQDALGLSENLLNYEHEEVYFSHDLASIGTVKLRKHGDSFTMKTIHSTTFYKSQGRSDDTMNIGGIKISSIEIENAINRIDGVVESAAVSYNNGGLEKLKIVLVSETDIEDNIVASALRKENPLVKISKIEKTEKLPRTASGKIMRRLLR